MARKIRILLVDDHRLVRHTLAHLITKEADMEIIGEASDGQESINLAKRFLPAVVLMDVAMPNMNGITATRIIGSDCPEVRVIGL